MPYEDLQDPYGIEFWPDYPGRDGCRTPMVWDQTSTYAGFSEVKPWLPIPEDHMFSAVTTAEQNVTSLLNHYRAILAFRKSHPAMRKGTIEFDRTDGDVLTFVRSYEDDHVFCAFNLSPEAREIPIDSSVVTPLDHKLDFYSEVDNDLLRLPAYGVYFGSYRKP